jgi:hypothetical protein
VVVAEQTAVEDADDGRADDRRQQRQPTRGRPQQPASVDREAEPTGPSRPARESSTPASPTTSTTTSPGRLRLLVPAVACSPAGNEARSWPAMPSAIPMPIAVVMTT